MWRFHLSVFTWSDPDLRITIILYRCLISKKEMTSDSSVLEYVG